MGLVRTIRVRDSHGDELTLYEFAERRFFRKVFRLQLETGEAVVQRYGLLVIAATGERLTLIE